MHDSESPLLQQLELEVVLSARVQQCIDEQARTVHHLCEHRAVFSGRESLHDARQQGLIRCPCVHTTKDPFPEAKLPVSSTCQRLDLKICMKTPMHILYHPDKTLNREAPTL